MNLKNKQSFQKTLAVGALPLAAFGAEASDLLGESTLPPPPSVAAVQATETQPERALSPRAQAWLQKQLELAQNSIEGSGRRLVDGTVFLTVAADRALQEYVGQADTESGLKFRAVSENGYSYAFTSSTGDTWYVAESPYYRDQYPNGLSFARSSFTLYKKGSQKLTQKEFHTRDVFLSESDSTIDFKKVQQLINKAEANRASEEQDAMGVRALRLGSSAIGYVGLVDGNRSDPIMAAMQDDTRYLPQFMNSLKDAQGQARYNFVSNRNGGYREVDRQPYDLLRSELRQLQARGVKTFYIVLNGHGNDNGVHFTVRRSRYRYNVTLRPEQLKRLFDEFRDSRFIVDTVACYGGGFAEALKSYRDPSGESGRVFVKLQAKPLSYNQEGRILEPGSSRAIPKPHSSYYNIFKTYYLSKGLNIGEAHWQADRAAKRFIACDAEAWLSSPDGGRATLRANSETFLRSNSEIKRLLKQ